MRCSTVVERLPALMDAALPGRIARHVERCESCRGEVARYEQLGAALGSLGAEHIEPPADLRPALIALARAPRRLMRSHLVRNRRAYLRGAAVAAAAAGMAGAMAARSWGRNPAAA